VSTVSVCIVSVPYRVRTVSCSHRLGSWVSDTSSVGLVSGSFFAVNYDSMSGAISFGTLSLRIAYVGFVSLE